MHARARTLIAVGGLALAISGCGNADGPTTVLTRTVFQTVTAPTAASTSTASTTSSGTTPGTTTSTTSATSTATTANAALTVRQAAAIVRQHHFTTSSTSSWDPAYNLNVLVATATASGDGYNQQAFFFYRDRFIGTDAPDPSAVIRFVRRTDADTLELSYQLYAATDPMCCPSRGTAVVHFHWDGAQLDAVDPLPPLSERQ